MKTKIIKGFFLAILFIFLLYKTFDYFGAIGYRETWTICLDYIHEDKLWIGQPHCEGAIIPLLILSILDSIVGREFVQVAAIVFSTIISGIFFWIFFSVVKKEFQERDFFWPLLFFGLFFFINNIINIESILNSFFFFIAFYILFYTEWKLKYITAGFFLLLSILSKINVIVQIAFLLFWYAYEKKVWYFEDKKLKVNINKNVFLWYIQLALPIIIGLSFLTLYYKYFWIYSLHVFTNQTISLSVFETIKEMILFDVTKADIIYIPTMVIAVLGVYLFCKEKKVYCLLSGPCFLLAIFLIVRAFGIQFATGVRYWSVIMPFAIMTLLRIKQLWITVPSKQIFQGVLIILIIYPGFYYSPFHLKDDLSYIDNFNIVDRWTNGWKEKDSFIKEIHYGYSIVPQQEGRILLENDPFVFKRMLISLGSNIPYEKVDFLTKKYMESHPDAWGFPRYKELLGEDLIYAPLSSELNKKEKEIIEKIENGTYSLIIHGPPEWAISQKIINNLNNETFNSYCQVAVPNNVWLTEEGWHYSSFFFKNHEDCMEIAQKMYIYFDEQYKNICTQDQFTANMITSIMRQNGFPFNKECTIGGSVLSFLKGGIAIKKTELLIMIILFSLPLLYQINKIKKDSSITEKQRRLYYIILILLAVIFIIILTAINTTIPYKEGFVQSII